MLAEGVARDERSAPVLAPDGRAFAYVFKSALWVRRFDTLQPIRIAGTDGAQYPFWSPDSKALGFFAKGSIRRVPVAGGEVSVSVSVSMDLEISD